MLAPAARALTISPENYGVALGEIKNPELAPGEMTQITVSVQNTGIFSDTFSLEVECQGLGGQVSISGSNEVTLGPGASSMVERRQYP